jgi:DNA repair photolyase
MEPWAPAPEVRIEVLRRLAEAGLRVCLSVAPILPAITDGEAELNALLARAASVGVKRMFYNVLFLRSPTKEKYLRWIEQEFPRYLESYRRAYDGRVYLGGPYRERIRERVRRLRSKHGFDSGDEQEQSASRFPTSAEQLALWT